MSSVDHSALHLKYDPVLRVAGEVITGEVHLHFPSLMKDTVKEVHVRLHGSVFT